MTGSFFSSASWRVIETKLMPRYGRLSGSPAIAWAMIGRAMSIGMAKPMPLLFEAIAVLMPMTFPPASRSGPPELPGLIAASVWMRLVSESLLSVVIDATLGRHDPARDRVRIGAQRAADGDDQLADLERVGLADGRRRQAGRVDLDDGQVGQRVDAVDGAGQDPPVLELDVELLAALDDVVVGQDPAVAVEDDARADAGRRG